MSEDKKSVVDKVPKYIFLFFVILFAAYLVNPKAVYNATANFVCALVPPDDPDCHPSHRNPDPQWNDAFRGKTIYPNR